MLILIANSNEFSLHVVLNNVQSGGFGEVVNTADCGPVMRGFDPHIPPQIENKLLYATFFIELNMLSLL